MPIIGRPRKLRRIDGENLELEDAMNDWFANRDKTRYRWSWRLTRWAFKLGLVLGVAVAVNRIFG